jgi:hypothetical protein
MYGKSVLHEETLEWQPVGRAYALIEESAGAIDGSAGAIDGSAG